MYVLNIIVTFLLLITYTAIYLQPNNQQQTACHSFEKFDLFHKGVRFSSSLLWLLFVLLKIVNFDISSWTPNISFASSHFFCVITFLLQHKSRETWKSWVYLLFYKAFCVTAKSKLVPSY